MLLSTHIAGLGWAALMGSLASGFWLDQTKAVISRRSEGKRTESAYLFSLRAPLLSPWADCFFRCTLPVYLCPEVPVTAPFTYHFRPWDFLCCRGCPQWGSGLFSQFSLVPLLVLNCNNKSHQEFFKLLCYLHFLRENNMVATDLKPSYTHITFMLLCAFSRQCFKCKVTLEYNNLSAGQIALFLTKFCSNV